MDLYYSQGHLYPKDEQQFSIHFLHNPKLISNFAAVFVIIALFSNVKLKIFAKITIIVIM